MNTTPAAPVRRLCFANNLDPFVRIADLFQECDKFFELDTAWQHERHTGMEKTQTERTQTPVLSPALVEVVGPVWADNKHCDRRRLLVEVHAHDEIGVATRVRLHFGRRSLVLRIVFYQDRGVLDPVEWPSRPNRLEIVDVFHDVVAEAARPPAPRCPPMPRSGTIMEYLRLERWSASRLPANPGQARHA